jgi:hypothetical protein
MIKSRINYLILINIAILFGLGSRKLSFVPLFIGDVIWASMVFFIIRFLYIKIHFKWVVLTSLFFCYGIELTQLYHEQWIDSMRNTSLGALILGHEFLWTDIVAYTFGNVICLLGEIALLKQFPCTYVGKPN